MSHRQFTDEQEAELARLYREGWSYPQLAQQYDTSTTVVRWAMKRQGVTPRRCGRHPYAVPGPLVDEVKQRYASGDSQTKIADALAITQAMVSRVIHRSGMTKPRRMNRDGHGNWKGGRARTTGGYVCVLLEDSDPFYCIANSAGYALEHRLVMARYLGRPLTANETVHHVNGDKIDNRLENLQLRMARHGSGKALRCADCGSMNIITVELDTEAN